MAWVAVHPDNTTEVQVPEGKGPWFTVGFWPPREAERFNMMLEKIQKPLEELDPVRDQDEYMKAVGLNYDTFRNMVAYGVRDWRDMVDVEGEPFLPHFEEAVEIDGRPHKALSDASIDDLYVNRLLVAVALKCWLFNTLTQEEKKTSGLQLQSSSSTLPTSAPSVTPSSEGPPSESSETKSVA